MSVEADAELRARVAAVVRRCLGREPTRIEAIPAALGLRRFVRVWLPGEPATLVARVEAPEDPAGRPPGIPPEPPLEPIRALMERGGLPVPRRLGADEAGGIELLEDAGATSLAQAVEDASDAERQALYRRVCELVPRIQHLADPGGVEAFSRRLDDAHFAYKADLFCRYGLAEAGRTPSPAQERCVRDAFARVARLAAAAPQRLAHRDLQSQNVMVRDDPARPIVLIDLQGALLAPPEYDLVCLLRDAYVELPEDEIALHFERTRASLPDAPDPETSRHRFDCLTLTRKGKDHARYRYAARERGDARYLRFAPAALRHLRRAAAAAAARDPAFCDLRDLLEDLPEAPPAPEAPPTPEAPCAP